MRFHSDAMWVMAETYLKLANTTADQEQRKRFLSYAAAYRQLSGRSMHSEKPMAVLRRDPSPR